MADKKPIGKISHYYDKIGVGIIELKGSLKAGDTIKVKGKNTDFEQAIDSMQIEHEEVQKAKKGDIIGIKMSQKVKEGDEIYLSK